MKTEKRVNKYSYVKVIQQNYGQGFEDVSEYTCDSNYIPLEFNNKVLINKYGREYKETLLRHDLREYMLMGYVTRVINRRVLNVWTDTAAERQKRKLIFNH